MQETLALEPVELITAGIPIRVFTEGTSRKILKKNIPRVNIDNSTNQKLHIFKFLINYQPDIVITGMVSELQYRLSQHFKKNNVEIISYYDAFHSFIPGSVRERFIEISSQVLVPSTEIEKSIQTHFPYVIIRVVGHPSLDSWLSISKKNLAPIKEQLNINPTKRVLLFIGGYGDEYEKGFPIFAESIPLLKEFEIIFLIHPKLDESVEREKLKNHPHLHFLTSKEITTAEIVAISDIVLTINSTVGVQAAFLR